MIITIAGKIGEDGRKVHYNCDILGIENGKYLNSLDILLGNHDQYLTIIGSEEAIELQKKLFRTRLEARSVPPVYHLFNPQKSDSVFSLIFKILEEVPLHEPIVLDITHGYRDNSMVAAYAAMVLAFMNNHRVKLVYAKIQSKDHYEFIELNDYMDLTEYTFYLRLFYHNCSIGHYKGEDKLLRAMYQFGEDFLSNSIQKLISVSYPNLKKVLFEAKAFSHFTPLHGLIEKIEERLVFMGSYHELQEHEQYMVLAKFAESMNYSIIALTYLHESISWFLYNSLGEILLTKKEKEQDHYSKTQSIRSIVRHDNNDQIFGHSFFQTMDEIKEMRNNLAHLSMEYEKGHVKLMNLYINRVDEHYKSDFISAIRLDLKKQKEKNEKIDMLEQELMVYLKSIYGDATISLKHLVPVLLSSDIGPSAYIPKKTLGHLNRLISDSHFHQKLVEYDKLLNHKENT